MNILEFKNTKELENALATHIAQKLQLAIKRNGKANILVSGGSTPIGMYHLLSLKEIDWSKVNIGLADERYVSANSEHSNEKLIGENLMINEAEQAIFIGMMHITNAETENLKRANADYAFFYNEVDVCVLGMGEDGHTASLFPNDPASEENLKSENLCLVSTRAPKEPLERISCSKSLLLSSKNIYIMLTGLAKKNVIKCSVAKQLPISYITQSSHESIEIFYADNK